MLNVGDTRRKWLRELGEDTISVPEVTASNKIVWVIAMGNDLMKVVAEAARNYCSGNLAIPRPAWLEEG